jgi:tRNA A-37 threonylcarbamoyl transferase component Bud32
MNDAALSLVPEELAEIARRGLKLPATAHICVREVTHLANLNYVFHVVADGASSYLKVVTDTPKLLNVKLPRERIFYEAVAIDKFRRLCGPTVAVPQVLYVDKDAYALGMSDVGQDRRPLLEVIDDEYSLLGANVAALGIALGQVHSRSRGHTPLRPPQFESMLETVIVDWLLAPGAQAVFADHWPRVAAQLKAHHECLVHGDLWAKNLLVDARGIPGVVDFEGASIGDPAFDIATVLAVAAIPALKQPALLESCGTVSRALVDAYGAAARENLGPHESAWPQAVCARAYLYVGTLLAARAFGPFNYTMSAAARERLGGLARSLTVESPADIEQYCERLREHCGAAQRAAA